MKLHFITRLLLLGSLILASPLFADDSISADRPGIGDGSLVVGRNVFQIETGVQESYGHGESRNDHGLQIPTLLRYGVSDDFELRIESNTFSYSRNYDAGEVSSTTGYSPVSIGAKYQFIESEKDEPTAASILRIYPPSGSSDFRSKHVTSDLRFMSDWDIGSFSLEGNLGGAVYEDDSQKMFGAFLATATVTKNITESFAVFLDSGIQEPQSKTSGALLLADGGLTYLPDSETQLDISAGTGLSGKDSPDIFWGAGISRRFR